MWSLPALAVLIIGACAGSREVAEPALESRATEAEPAAPARGSGPAAGESSATAATAAPSKAAHSSAVTLLADGPAPVRGRIVDHGVAFVEVAVKGVERSAAGQTPRIRYTLRLCSEDGATSGRTHEWSTEKGVEALPDDFVFESAPGSPFSRVFQTPAGTYWEIRGTASVNERGDVRFELNGRHLACIK